MDDVFSAQVNGTSIEIVLLRERMDAAAALKFKDGLNSIWQPGLTGAVIDLGNVEFIDSSGVGALLGVYRRFAEGAVVSLKSMRPQVLSVIELLRLHRIFQIQS